MDGGRTKENGRKNRHNDKEEEGMRTRTDEMAHQYTTRRDTREGWQDSEVKKNEGKKILKNY